MQQNNSFRAPKKRTFHTGNRQSSFGGNRGGSRGPKKQTIHPSKFINRATEGPETEAYVPKHQFGDFALGASLQNNLKALNFTTPSPIQDQAIPFALEGKNVVGLANTGTGKTAAFLLPILEKLSHGDDRNSVLIMAPTRELAQQIDDEFRRFARGMDLYAVTCVGGMNIERQIRDLRRRPHIIIGTPGRLKDLLQRRVLVLTNVTTLVLDEVDRMLDMGFVNEIRELVKLLPSPRQTLCFSATITPTIQSVIRDLVTEYELVSVKTSETNQHIDQDVVMYDGKDHKLEVLKNILRDNHDQKILVFGETKFGVQRLADALSQDDIPAAAIHGNKSQSQRQRALDAFKGNRVKVLIATDVAARGLDINDVSHVINFDQPQTYDDYVHRIGRTGRAGKTGKALTFVAGPRSHN
jgi:ATP-dependent RNA helicase RhlE